MARAPFEHGSTGPQSASGPASARSLLALRWVHPATSAPSILLTRAALRLGREPDNDLVLAGNAISRHHARIERRGDAVAIADLRSRNGVYVDGQRTELAPLVPGSVVRVGDWVGVLHEQTRDGPGALAELFGGMIGSDALYRVLDVARRVARSQLSVLIQGETGTGKELVAQAVHAESGRPGPFVPVNCAALAESLLDAELFGNERGAFTGADRARSGWIRAAHGGTLFLDEVGELTPAAQGKLLRVLEAHEVTPVGSTARIPVDLRVVAATHRDLRALVRQDRFRADLFARLEGASVHLPSLRARREDIVGLFAHFAARALGRPAPLLSAGFAQALALYSFPGNVRELEKVAGRLATLAHDAPAWRTQQLAEVLPLSPERISASPAAPNESAGPVPSPRAPLSQKEREILAALSMSAGNVTSAARRLGFSKQSLYRWLSANSIDLRAFRPGSSLGD